MKLPVQLGKPPLVDLVFEVRFATQLPAASLLPGFLLTQLGDVEALERLPVSEIPEQLRSSDVQLRYAPLLRAQWKKFIVLIGERNLGLGCGLDYPGWKEFKPAILRLMQVLQTSNIVREVERFSFKSVDVFHPEFGAASNIIELKLAIGPAELAETLFQVRSEIKESDRLLHVLQLVAQGKVNFADGRSRTGVLLDIDTIATPKESSMADFIAQLPDELETLHAKNKTIFFECLRPEALAKLEPQYDG